MKNGDLTLGRVEAIVNKLGGMDGVERFLRGELVVSELTRSSDEPPPVEYWRKLSETAIEVNLDAPLRLPFDGAKIQWQPPAGRGWVKVERIGDDLFVGGSKVIQHREPEQMTGVLQGLTLHKRLQNRDTLDPRILDALVEFENGRLIPESLKVDSEGRTLYNYFWEAGFRDRDGSLCVRCLFWGGGRWLCYYNWLDGAWLVQRPALLLAS